MIRVKYKHTIDMFRWLLNLRVENFIAFAVVAYFSGWHYVNTYFSSFGINRSSISFESYTVFLYSFYVVVEIPTMLALFPPDSRYAFATLVALLIVSGIEFPDSVHASVRLLQRTVVVALGIGSLYFFSIAAGSSDAKQVIHDKRARPVTITFTEDVKKALEAQYDTRYANDVVDELREAGRLGALALIWRSSEETVILQYDTAEGAGHGSPIATYRIPNQFIALIESREIGKRPSS